MARMPGTDWIGPTPNQRMGGMSEHRGLVLHIQDGTEAGSEAWFKNPDSQASAHFLNPKVGNLRQLVDTDDRAWTQAAGNAYWVSVENEGRGGDALTASQIENCARLLVWLNRTYGVPLQLTDDPNGRGLGWHGMGGSAWGGHYDCPGKAVLAQRAQILARAQQIINPAMSEEDELAITLTQERSDEWNGMIWGLKHTTEATLALVQAQGATIAQLATAVAQVHGIDPDALVAQIREAIAAAVVKVDVSVGQQAAPTAPKGA